MRKRKKSLSQLDNSVPGVDSDRGRSASPTNPSQLDIGGDIIKNVCGLIPNSIEINSIINVGITPLELAYLYKLGSFLMRY